MYNIEMEHIYKTYSNFSLKDVTLRVPKGCIVGLIGENGAGKTTLIKLLLGSILLDSGTISLLDGDMNPKEEIGVVLDGAFFPEILKISDIDSIMKSVYKKWDSVLFFQYLKKFDVPNKQAIKTLSKGTRKKLEIITALAHHPKLLILDEPTSGLDPVVRTEILDLLMDFIQEEENSILFSTHITSDLEHIADYIAFLHKGELSLNQSKDELLEEYGLLKVNESEFQSIDKKDLLCFKKNKYQYEALVKQKVLFRKKYPHLKLDRTTIEDIMVLYIKGECL